MKAKRLQSVGELPGLVPTTAAVHGRPSIAGVNTSDTQEAEDKTPPPPTPVVESSANKSPVNAGCGEWFYLLSSRYLDLNTRVFCIDRRERRDSGRDSRKIDGE